MLKPVIEDINTVEEPLRGLYTEQKGEDAAAPSKWVLAVDNLDSHPGVQGLKSAHEKTKNEVAEMKKQAAKYKNVDVEKYNALVLREKELQDQADKNDPEKLRKRISDEYEGKLKEKDDQVEDYRGKFTNVALIDRIKSAALAGGVIPADVDDVVELTRKNFKLDESSLKVSVMEDGQNTGETLEHFFKESFKTKKPKFYTATVGTGGGSPGSGGGGAGGKGDIHLTKEQAKDVATYRATKAEAAKAGRKLIIDD